MSRPTAEESAAYYFTYIDKVEGDDFLKSLHISGSSTLDLMEKLSAEQWDHAYDEGKWTLKEVFIHIIDTERVFAYRAMRIARGDETPLPGFEQNGYVVNSNARGRSAASIMDEYSSVRKSTIELFKNFDDEMINRLGTASGNPVSVRALGFMIAGHEIHHVRIVNERYLKD